MFLHDDPGDPAALGRVAEALLVPRAQVEKDYFITPVLWALQALFVLSSGAQELYGLAPGCASRIASGRGLLRWGYTHQLTGTHDDQVRSRLLGELPRSHRGAFDRNKRPLEIRICVGRRLAVAGQWLAHVLGRRHGFSLQFVSWGSSPELS